MARRFPVKLQSAVRTSSAAPEEIIGRIGAEKLPLSTEARESADFVDAVEAAVFRLPLTRVTAALDLKRRLQVVDRAAVGNIERTWDVRRIERSGKAIELYATRSA